MGMGGNASKGCSAEDAAGLAIARDEREWELPNGGAAATRGAGSLPNTSSGFTLKELFFVGLGFGLSFGSLCLMAAALLAWSCAEIG